MSQRWQVPGQEELLKLLDPLVNFLNHMHSRIAKDWIVSTKGVAVFSVLYYGTEASTLDVWSHSNSGAINAC